MPQSVSPVPTWTILVGSGRAGLLGGDGAGRGHEDADREGHQQRRDDHDHAAAAGEPHGRAGSAREPSGANIVSRVIVVMATPGEVGSGAVLWIKL